MKRFGLTSVVLVALLAGPWGAAVAQESNVPPEAEQPSAPGADDTATQRVQAYVQPSIVYLDLTWTGYIWDTDIGGYLNGGRAFEVPTQCTGFVVNPNGYIATAGHCVDPAEVAASFAAQGLAYWQEQGFETDVTVEAALAANTYRADGQEPQFLDVRQTRGRNQPTLVATAGWGASASGLEASEQMTARVVDFQPFAEGDVALLKVEATDLNAIQLTEDSETAVGTDVVSIGYPASVDMVTDPDFQPSFKTGSISQQRTVQNGLLTVYEIDAAISGGMSGGPTVDNQGRVVGLNSFKIEGESQPFNFIRPVSSINELLGSAGVANELSETSRQYRTGLDAYFAGDKEAAVRALQAVVDDQPANELAQDYLNRARDLPAPETGPPTLAILGGLLFLLLAVGAAAFLFVKRRRGAAPTPVVPAPFRATPTASDPGDPGFVAAAGSTVVVPHPQQSTAPAPTPATTAAPTPASLVNGAPSVATTPARHDTATASVDYTPHAYCGDCGTKAIPGQRFCGSCGSQL